MTAGAYRWLAPGDLDRQAEAQRRIYTIASHVAALLDPNRLPAWYDFHRNALRLNLKHAR